MSKNLINEIESTLLKNNAPEFEVGDTVKVKVLIREGNKERNQNFEGMVISKKGAALNTTFTVRRIFQGIAIERTFLLHSPKVVDVKVVRKGKTRRAKLYYMRKRVGTKSTRLKEDSSRIARDFQEKLIQQEKKEAAKKAPKKEETNAEENPEAPEEAAATTA